MFRKELLTPPGITVRAIASSSSLSDDKPTEHCDDVKAPPIRDSLVHPRCFG